MKFKMLLDQENYLAKDMLEKKNPLKNFYALVKLNPHALTLKRSRILRLQRKLNTKAKKEKLIKENKWVQKENKSLKKFNLQRKL